MNSLLAAYDLGAPAGLLQEIYNDEARIQRPIFLDETDKAIVVNEENWPQYLGNHKLVFTYYVSCQADSS